MVNPFQAVCNEQMAFSRYYLKLLGARAPSRLIERAYLQALAFALQQSMLAYASELAFTLLRRSDAVVSVQQLQELAAEQGAVSPEIAELDGLSQQAGSWLDELGYFSGQSTSLTLFGGQGSSSAEALDATLIASSRVVAPDLTAESAGRVYAALEELVQRQRSHNIEC